MSISSMRYGASRSRSSGKTTLTRWSRSACMSRKVEEMNTRTVRQAAMVPPLSTAHRQGLPAPITPNDSGVVPVRKPPSALK